MSDNEDLFDDELGDEGVEIEDEGVDGGSGGHTADGRSRKRRDKRRGRAVDDDEDEEEENDEEDGGSRKRRRGQGFFEEEAEVDEDEDDEHEEEDDGQDIIHDDEVPEDVSAYLAHRNLPQREMPDEEMNEDELRQFVRERYERPRGGEAVETEEVDAAHQQSLRPTREDSKLWLVPCRPGSERELVVQLYQKSQNQEQHGGQLLIKSTFCLDQLSGYVYVEADKLSHVRDATKGLRNVMQTKDPKLVPLNQMVDALTISQGGKSLIHIDAFVRVKAGRYKNDLGQVLDVDSAGGRVVLKLVPRIDWGQMKSREHGGAAGPPKPSAVRPPPRPVSEEDAKAHSLNPKSTSFAGIKCWQINSDRFTRDGYVIKTVSIKGVNVEDPPPLSDVSKFKSASIASEDRLEDPSDLLASAHITPSKTTFQPGDKVRVVAGDLLGLTGRVESINMHEEKVMVDPDLADLKGRLLPIDRADLEKDIRQGMQVRVNRGKHTDEVGMVVSVEGKRGRVLLSSIQEQVDVLLMDLTETAEVSTQAVESLGPYSIHDAVMLQGGAVGVIIGVSADSCRVLTNEGDLSTAVVQTCRLPDIQKAMPRRLMACSDKFGTSISKGDMVAVVAGPHTGQSGTVHYTFKNMLWVLCHQEMRNSGFFVVRSKECRRKGAPVALPGGGGGAAAGGGRLPPMSPAIGLRSPSIHRSGFSSGAASPRREPMAGLSSMNRPGMFSGRANVRIDDSLVGKKVVITRGGYRGYEGRVKSATQTHLRVEMDAAHKIVTVARESCTAMDGDRQNGLESRRRQSTGWGSRTPMHRAQTPMHAWTPSTPSHAAGSRTPMHDPTHTPMLDPTRTPMHNPLRTPMHEANFMEEAPTPGYNMGTPYDMRDGSTPAANGLPGTPGGGSGGLYDSNSAPGGSYNPATPGMVGGGEAGTPGGAYDNVATPGMAAGGYDGVGTPGGGAYGMADTPAVAGTPGYDSAFTPGGTPGSAGYTATPRSAIAGTPGYTPGTVEGTPGTPGMAFTPGAAYGADGAGEGQSAPEVGGDAREHWVGCEVMLGGDQSRQGVVRKVSGDDVTVELGQMVADRLVLPEGGGEEQTVTADQVQLVVPRQKDVVKILYGENLGNTGSLMTQDEGEGIVKMDKDGHSLDFVPMEKLARVHAPDA